MKFILFISLLFLSLSSTAQVDSWGKVVIERADDSESQPAFYNAHPKGTAITGWLLFALVMLMLYRRRVKAHNEMVQEETITAPGIAAVDGSEIQMKVAAIVFAAPLTILTLNACFG